MKIIIESSGPRQTYELPEEKAHQFLEFVRSLQASSSPQPAVPSSPDLIEALESERGQRALTNAIFGAFWQLQSDTNAFVHVMSTAKSAEFILKNIPLHLGKRLGTLQADALKAAPADGLFLEFGVWKAYWITTFASLRPEAHFYGFDSFEGLPASWSTHLAGYFDLGGKLPTVPSNVTLIKGWFSDTLPAFFKDRDTPVSFVHIDCDLYSSTKAVMEHIGPRLRPGSQIVLDDFLQQPGWEEAEHKAFLDYMRDHKIAFEYTGWQVGSPGCSVSVKIL